MLCPLTQVHSRLTPGPTSFALSFLLLLSLPVRALSQAVPCSYTVPAGSPDTLLKYDLCPLLPSNSKGQKLRVTVDESTPPTHTQHIYDVALFGTNGLERDGTLPSDLQCPEGTWVCLTVINTRPNHPSEPSRILQIIPVASLSNIKAKAIHTTEDQLQVTFHGGMYNNRKQKAQFRFECNPASKEPTSPTFLWSFNGTHTFSWSSKYACPTSVPNPGSPSPSDPPPDTDEPPDNPPPDSEDSGRGESDLHERNSSLLPISGLIIVCFLFIVRYLLRRPSRISKYLFRPRGFDSVEARKTDDLYRISGIATEEVELPPWPDTGKEPLVSPISSKFRNYGL
ncbi:autophagy-related protein 27-domain-containing protein [Crassisporium funariophilum]|nr:autophagy-related protein 27-domain-containing protein [Crassisporium funariophilum]